ncbi:MAG: transcriptional regulator [Micrococcales bacterium]|nr:MAG: transcriptional regulator [Micrococcales bacterium]
MLALLSLLQTHRYWPGAELASRLGVSERTVRRDVGRLRDLGYEVDAVRGVAGGYQLRAGRALPPLLLDNEEAVAIAVGLRGSAASVLDGDGDAAVRALTKVVAMLPPRLRHRMDALAAVTHPGPPRRLPSIDAQTLTTLAGCCRDQERARFSYVAKDGARTERRVEPHQLVSYAQRWYLVAFDLDRQDWRTFRLDRMTDVQIPGNRFRPRQIPGGSALEYVKAGRRNSHAGTASRSGSVVRQRICAGPSVVGARSAKTVRARSGVLRSISWTGR